MRNETKLLLAMVGIHLSTYQLVILDKVKPLEVEIREQDSMIMNLKSELESRGKISEDNIEKLEQDIERLNKTNKDLKNKLEVKNRQRRELQIASRGKSMLVPKEAREFKSYMDYRAITNKSSKQYQLQTKAKTNEEGFRLLDDKYMIALGSAYGSVGEEVDIHLDGGKVSCIIADQKADRHTDSTNRYHKVDGSVVEFIVDTRRLERPIKQMGDCSYASRPSLKGRVHKIVNKNRRD